MLSLTQFRKNIFNLFRVQADTGLVLHVGYNGIVYQVEVKRTDLPYRLSRPKKAKTGIRATSIPVDDCSECGSLRFAGVCMNSKCPTVLNATPEIATARTKPPA